MVVKVYQLVTVPRMALENTRARCCTIASSTKMRSVSKRENRTRNEKLHHQFTIDTTCILFLAEGSKGIFDTAAPLLGPSSNYPHQHKMAGLVSGNFCTREGSDDLLSIFI